MLLSKESNRTELRGAFIHLFHFQINILLVIHDKYLQRNSKIPKGQTEIVKSEDKQDNGQQNETKDKHMNTQHYTENLSWSHTNLTKTRVIKSTHTQVLH